MTRRAAVLAMLLFAAPADPATALDGYPNASIRFIVATSAGGPSDIFIRSVSDELQKTLKHTSVVENKPGGAFNISARACADAPPDGYTFCVLPNEVFTVNRYLFSNLSYDAEKDLKPITTLFYIPQILVVRSDLNVKSVDDLATLSKAKPKTLSYASPGLSQMLFIEEYVNAEKGGDLVKVPFRGGADAVNGIMTGTTPVAFIGLSNVAGLIQSDKVVAIAIDGRQRIASLPNVPTVSETGFRGDILQPFYVLAAPAKTPISIVAYIKAEITRIIADPEFRRRNITDRWLTAPTGPDDEVERLIATQKPASERVVRKSGPPPQ